METLKVTTVSVTNKPTGYCDKVSAHQKPILHRAFSIFLVDKNKMLIQQRALNKYHCAGLWSNACCSHPVGNTLHCAKKRLKEELNINCKIKKVFDFVYYSKFENNVYEYEFDYVFIGDFDSTKKIDFNKDEINDLKWVSFKTLKNLLKNNPEMFTPWFLHACPKIIKYCENINKK